MIRRPPRSTQGVSSAASDVYKRQKYSQAKIELSLFNLHQDIGETTDVKANYPKILAKMLKLGEGMRNELGDQGRKGKGQRSSGRLTNN